MDEPPYSKQKPSGVEGFAAVNDDILQKILSNLPALSFSFASCVSRTWNQVCKRILCRPKFASALSLNPSLQDALNEVFDKVLSEPILPHFAFACIGINFKLNITHELMKKKLGSKTPIITSVARGIIGTDAVSNEFREVKWTEVDEEDLSVEVEAHNVPENINRGITLIVGFVPGLKVETVPLLRSKEEPYEPMVDKFVVDIRDYTTSVSGSTSPKAILMFGDQHTDMRPILAKMDHAMSPKTAIVGDECGDFLYDSIDPSRFFNAGENYSCDAVAFIFARDREKREGIGETHFHVMLSTGVSPIGSSYKAVSVKVNGKYTEYSTWLTARKEGVPEILDGQRILNDVNDELEDVNPNHQLYVGVTKRRKCFIIGSVPPGLVTSLSFHEVLGGDEEYLYLDGGGIKTGDMFRFYYSDPDTAISSCAIVSENLKNLKQLKGAIDNGDKEEVCGGVIFACYGRGDTFFGRQNVDSSPFFENFPGVPVVGLFCDGEIGRGGSRYIEQEGSEPSSLHRYMHVYSTVYLVMSYTPPVV